MHEQLLNLRHLLIILFLMFALPIVSCFGINQIVLHCVAKDSIPSEAYALEHIRNDRSVSPSPNPAASSSYWLFEKRLC